VFRPALDVTPLHVILSGRLGASPARSFGDDPVTEVKAAIGELKNDLNRVSSAIEAKRRGATVANDREGLVHVSLDKFESIAGGQRDNVFPL